MNLNTITHTDALSFLQSLPDNCVHCIITSPPYWNLRDYGVDGQLGLEPTLTEYLDNLTSIFTEARRVLREDGVMWLNMGDGYAATTKGNNNGTGASTLNNGAGGGAADKAVNTPPRKVELAGLKPKDLIGQPWRLAFRLQDDGWWLRSDIIWFKPNPLPESVTDRPTKSHEYVFLMTKSARYWYDAYAIREAMVKGDSNSGAKNYRITENGTSRKHVGQSRIDNPAGRNKRTVWRVATAAMKAAHFATFPPALIRPMVLAGCPPKVCVECGKPWERVVEPTEEYKQQLGKGWNDHENRLRVGHIKRGKQLTAAYISTGFQPTCGHDAPTEPGIVLDMFMGAGTTALVATQHGRRWLGCELNADYIDIANDRLSVVQVNMFTSEGL